MNIAFLVGGSIKGGGAERATSNLVNEMVISNHNIFLFTGIKGEDEYYLNPKVVRKVVFNHNFILDTLNLGKLLIYYKIDVAIGMGIYANLCACLLKKIIRTKIIISERNSPAHDLLSIKTKLLRFILYRFADGYVFQTKEAKEYYSQNIQRKSVVIHNPIKPDLPYKSNVNNKEIIAVGRLNKQKNYPFLIKSFAIFHKNHRDYILKIYGKGNELTLLQKLSKDLHIEDSVIFEGFCSNVHEAIKDSQLFVMSSDFEGMPNSLMEAMAMGFPVISTDCPCGGPRELIVDKENGILLKTTSENELANKITQLIENRELANKLSIKAKEIRNTHSVKKIVSLWFDFINRVCNCL